MTRRSVVLASLFALGLAVPQTASAASGSAPITAPRLDYKMRTLPNGLKVYSVLDKSTPNVSVQVWYDVGSKEDPKGRSGFAHLFEHMLFKATRNMPAEFLDRLTEDVGGVNNASTADDYTNYYEVVPANHLQRILWAESERMGSLVVDEANFVSERAVVKEELRQRYLASPYGRLMGLYLVQQSYTRHPYGRPGIGSIEDLDAATIEDVRAFHEAFYRPDNAHLIVVGNFDPAQLDRWVDRYFGPIKKPSRPVPRLKVVEPVRTGPRTVTTFGPNVPLPGVVVTYPSPAASNPDAAPMAVLDAILSAGESSRLYQTMVYDKQVAAEVFSMFDPGEEASIIAPGAIAAGGKSLADVEAGLLAIVAGLRDAPVSAAELAEAKTGLIVSALRQRETIEGRGDALGRAILVSGDPRKVDTEIADLEKVTAADVQRVARKYLADNQRVVIRYLDESQRNGAADPKPADPQALVVPPASLAPVVAAAPEQRTPPPAPGPEVAVPTPKIHERTLANGLRVVVAPSGDLPLVNATLVVKAGAGYDPRSRPGVASMTATLMTQGTATRSAPQIASTVEALGASLSNGAGWDSSSLGINAPASNLEAAGAVLADIARNPAFADDELERQRAQALDGLEVAMRQPGSLAAMAAPRLLYASAPYGQQQGGTVTSLKALTTTDLKTYHQNWWRPEGAALVMTGDIKPDTGFALAERLFGDWKPAVRGPVETAPGAGDRPAQRIVVVNLPESGQAAVVAGLRAVTRKDPDYYPLLVANGVLGGGYSARLNQEVRIKRGLSYGANSSLSARKDEGVLTASTQTKNESAAEVAKLLSVEFARLAAEPVAEGELTPRKAVLTGQFGRTLGTTDGLAGLIANLIAYDLPLAELERYAPSVRAVTSADIRRAVQADLATGAPSIVVVGEAKAFVEDLRRQYPNLEVIEASALNFDSPTLR